MKNAFLGIFELLQRFPGLHRDIEVNDSFKWYLAFIKRKSMRRVLPPSGRNHGNNQSTVLKLRLNLLHLKVIKISRWILLKFQ